MTLPLCPARRLYRREKAKRDRRTARLVAEAERVYVRLCESLRKNAKTNPKRVAKTARRAA
jgi:hypothetical protein